MEFSKDKDRRFRSCFGAPRSDVVADLWNKIKDRGDCKDGLSPKHLLWALVFLKVYSTVEILCSIVRWPNEKTYREWSWYFVRRISELKDDLIILDNQFNGLNGVANTNCFISVDGTDCPVLEPWLFSKTMNSHKMNADQP